MRTTSAPRSDQAAQIAADHMARQQHLLQRVKGIRAAMGDTKTERRTYEEQAMNAETDEEVLRIAHNAYRSGRQDAWVIEGNLGFNTLRARQARERRIERKAPAR